MKWIYNIAEKLKLALALGIVFVLVIMTNMINKTHFSELAESITSIYEDRLMVENYIYKISGFLENKKMLTDNGEAYRTGVMRINRTLNDSIRQLIVDYEKTKFTEAESLYFSRFKQEFEGLLKFEEKYLSDTAGFEVLPDPILGKYRILSRSLDQLSEIQLSESRKIMDNSMRIIDTSNMASRVEIVILIVIGLIVQGLIFASRSLRPRITQNSNLN